MKYAIIAMFLLACACSSGADAANCTECAPGAPGAPGPQGEQGEQGLQGIRGLTGPQGTPGKDGAPGEDGQNGQDGETGETGPRGAQGIQGAQGQTGASGSDGRDGVDGGIGLYDSSGNQIDFVFELTNLGNYEMFKIPSNCIMVKLDDAGRPIDMAFDLATGDTMPCMSNRFDSWSMSNAVYLDENCSGNTYTLGYGGDEIVAIQGATYYPVSPAVSVPDYYGYENGTCLRQGGGAGAYVYRYEPVPTEILNLMPDPPYTIE